MKQQLKLKTHTFLMDNEEAIVKFSIVVFTFFAGVIVGMIGFLLTYLAIK